MTYSTSLVIPAHAGISARAYDVHRAIRYKSNTSDRRFRRGPTYRNDALKLEPFGSGPQSAQLIGVKLGATHITAIAQKADQCTQNVAIARVPLQRILQGLNRPRRFT